MNCFNRGVIAGLSAAFVVCGAHCAHAEESIQLIPLPGQVYLNDVLTNTTVNVDILTVFQKFDPGLGTLTGVVFSYDYDFKLTMDFPAAGGGGGASASGPFLLDGINPPGAGGGQGTGGGGAPGTTAEFPFSFTGTYIYPSDSGFADFVAAAPGQTRTWDFAATVSASPGADITSTVEMLNTSSVTVTYTYTPVPEPAALSLLVLGGATLLRRRRS